MTYHIVRMNENVEKIALIYQLSLEEIKECNQFIKDWDRLIPGTKLRLPEISDALNDQIDDTEPFIEEYYPSLNYDDFKQKKEAEATTNDKVEIIGMQDVSQGVTKKEDNKTNEEKNNATPIPKVVYPYFPYPYYPYSFNPNYPYYRGRSRKK